MLIALCKLCPAVWIMVRNKRTFQHIVIALGANQPSAWGPPPATFARVITSLDASGVDVIAISKLYRTSAVGPGLQEMYFNAVLIAHTNLGPAQLLRILNGYERRAGRRRGLRWGPRPLDLDIIDYKGKVLGPQRYRQIGRLTLPHPELQTRAFVLVPLLDVLPDWRHPVSGLPARTLLKRLSPMARHGVAPGVAFPMPACEKHK